ncbi:carbon-nitrogen hydrolase family protein [Pseudalkalibacillus decolorationis]|uniref:carbon-nitrogen hydrolase family protein n=1 Tax=Pseudalkalibacillus decolorationis TaxID=163879 RepID=UPI00214750E5|nr:carbon-nitrogen hydrolase family protein [Pseudalkalibacillus decolorationis]
MFNLTIAQFSPEIGNKIGNMNKMKNMIKEAKKLDSHFIMFPELALTGYCTSKIVFELAETMEGPCIKELRETCKENKIYAAISFIEKGNGEEEGIYIACALIDDAGEIVGVYRKTHLFDQETKIYRPGNELSIFNTKFGKIGIMICYDLEFPEVARTLRLKGADIILVPLANMKPYENYQSIYSKSRAMENEIPIVLCNQSEPLEGIDFFGQSIVVDLYGNTLMKMENKEQIETIALDMDVLKDKKLNYVQNRRTELYN